MNYSVERLSYFFYIISTSIVKEKVTLETSVDDKEGALLQIMKIPQLKLSKNDPLYEVVLWDTIY